MSKLDAAQRNALPAKDFAGKDRSYPIPDASHAVAAKSRATQAVNAGRMSAGEKAKIDAKANKKLPQRGQRTATNKPNPKKTGERLATWMA